MCLDFWSSMCITISNIDTFMCPDYLCDGYTARWCKIRNLFVRNLSLTLNSSNFVCLVLKHFYLFISLADELWALSWNISVNPLRMSENSYMSDIISIWPLSLVLLSPSGDLGIGLVWDNPTATFRSDCWNSLQSELNYLWGVFSCSQDDIRWF